MTVSDDPSEEEIAQQRELLAIYRRRLARNLIQLAQLGESFAPPAIFEGIHEARGNIQRIKTTLRGWHIIVEDHPDDKAPAGQAPDQPLPTPHPIAEPPLSRRVLREALLRDFSLGELEILCADVRDDLAQDGIDQQLNLALVGGDDLASTVVRLIDYLARRNYLDYLVRAIRRARPHSI
jgi:hypothetical protein